MGWLSIDKESGTGNDTLSVTAARNYSLSGRSGVVKVSDGLTERSVTIDQEGDAGTGLFEQAGDGTFYLGAGVDYSSVAASDGTYLDFDSGGAIIGTGSGESAWTGAYLRVNLGQAGSQDNGGVLLALPVDSTSSSMYYYLKTREEGISLHGYYNGVHSNMRDMYVAWEQFLDIVVELRQDNHLHVVINGVEEYDDISAANYFSASKPVFFGEATIGEDVLPGATGVKLEEIRLW